MRLLYNLPQTHWWLTQSGTLTKTGAGTTLKRNTYSGTTINAGTISIDDDSGLGAAPGSATAGHLTIKWWNAAIYS